MPRRDWCYVLAAVGCLAAASPGGHHHGKHTHHKHPQTYERVAPLAAVKPTPDPNNADAARKGCIGTDRPELTCGTAATQAAIEQARDADKSVVLATYQTWFIGFALIAAGAAAWYARQAAIYTEAGSNAARDALRHTKDEARAWLTIDLIPQNMMLDVSSGIPQIQFSYVIAVKNVGKVVANNVAVFEKPFKQFGFSEDTVKETTLRLKEERQSIDTAIVPGETHLIRRCHFEFCQSVVIESFDGYKSVNIISMVYVLYESFGDTKQRDIVRTFDILSKDLSYPSEHIARYGPVPPFILLDMLPLGRDNLVADHAGGTAT